MSSHCQMQFEQLGEDGHARRGRLVFPRGAVETPAFMPVGTYGTVKGMLPRTPLGRAMFKKLKVYAGSEHPHSAQQPQSVQL